MITCRKLRQRTDIITGDEADLIREKYISRFVDPESDHYMRYIAELREFSDGLYYTGYLWDCLKSAVQVEEEDVYDMELDRIVYVLWDLHSSDRIHIEDYWKFPRRAILRLRFCDLVEGRECLPEDIYIFDEELTWSLILTHEYDDKGNRFCYRAT